MPQDPERQNPEEDDEIGRASEEDVTASDEDGEF